MKDFREIRVEKVTVNMGVGQSGEELDKAITVLQKLTEAKPVKTVCKVRQPTWGIKKGLTIGAKVTLRKEKAVKFLKEALKAKDNQIKEKSFDKTGNFGFGVDEHIDLGIKYDPTIGIYGMDFFVVMGRAGTRVSRRRRQASKIGVGHKVSKDESMKWFQQKYEGIITTK